MENMKTEITITREKSPAPGAPGLILNIRGDTALDVLHATDQARQALHAIHSGQSLGWARADDITEGDQ